jgi:hypothetical protein
LPFHDRRNVMTRVHLTFALLLVAAPLRAAVSPDVLKQSEIVFAGTIVSADAAAQADVPQGTLLVAARVDQVLEKPPSVVLRKGDRVDIAVSDPSAYASGSRHTFYTAGWIYGERLTVRELAHEPAPLANALAASVPGMQQSVRDAKLKDAIDTADAVVTGRVVSVSTPKKLTAAAASEEERITEHDPEWHDAVVAVSEWMKGGTSKRVVVRFPASYDVMWYRVPKLKVGMTRTLLLHADTTPGPKAVMAGAPQAPRFMLLSPDDAQPAADAPRARRLSRH